MAGPRLTAVSGSIVDGYRKVAQVTYRSDRGYIRVTTRRT